MSNNGGIMMKKIIALSLITLFVLVGCGDNAGTGNNNNIHSNYNYMDDYELLLADIDHLNIFDLYDIAEMVFIAWEYNAYVEVEHHDYHGVDIEEINNEYQLEDFLAEIYHGDVSMYDVQVFEDDHFNLILLFIVDVQY